MNDSEERSRLEIPKAKTGIAGFDEISRGGLPRGSVTFVTGGSGSGKTVFGLQTLVEGASLFNEPGLFVAFEENSRKLRANAASFGWPSSGWEIMDAMPPADAVSIGEFDFSGMLAVLSEKVQAMNARRIVFDSLDVLLNLLPGAVERRREINRLHSWLLAEELTAIITAKLDWAAYAMPSEDKALQYFPFLVDCVVALTHEAENGFSRRRIRIIKYRGSSFFENDTPFVIGSRGMDVATAVPTYKICPSFNRQSFYRSSRVGRDALRGSFARIHHDDHRGAGTAKTTLGGAFAEAAAKRGEHTLYVAFDESSEEIVRNLSSVKIDLQTHLDNGVLQMHSENVASLGAEETFSASRRLSNATKQPASSLIRSRPSQMRELSRYPGGRCTVGTVGKKQRDYSGLHESAYAGRDRVLGNSFEDYHRGRHVDLSELFRQRRAEPRSHDSQVAGYQSLQSVARVNPFLLGNLNRRPIHSGWKRPNGHLAMAEGASRSRRAGSLEI